MLKIENLQKTYGSFSLNCSLTVKPGQITGLIGQNGAGKSTTFKAILGLTSPDGGSVTLLGKDISQFTPEDRARLGVVLSDASFSGYLTVKDIIAILGSLYKSLDRDFFLQQAKAFGLPMDKKIKDFSTGMQAKLKVLAAISHKAQLLILDEPTAGLDVVARDELIALLRQFMEQEEERAILISSHISSDLESLCDDLYMIHQGSIILHQDTHTLLGSYGFLQVRQEQWEALDKVYLLRVQKEPYGYRCLTDQKAYYLENAPEILVENGTVDGIITMLIKGEPV